MDLLLWISQSLKRLAVNLDVNWVPRSIMILSGTGSGDPGEPMNTCEARILRRVVMDGKTGDQDDDVVGSW